MAAAACFNAALAASLLGAWTQACASAELTDRAASEIVAAKSMIGEDWPADPEKLATTSGDIYLGNLNAQIESLSAQIDRTAATALKPRLATLLYHRFQVEGRLDDAESARALMQAGDAAGVLRPADHLAYARILLGFHDFAAAQNEITAAASSGAPAAAVSDARAALAGALHLPAQELPREAPADYLAAVRRAAWHVDRGEPARATELLLTAQRLYPDTSPFPLAWIQVQQGILFLRSGQLEAARTFFAAAHERMPAYFLAAEHLAETEGLLGNAPRSAELYRRVVTQNDQPAFWHGLAGAEAALGNDSASAEAAQRADDGYAALIARHPLMYADHAVSYYVETGRPDRALELARLNFSERQDVGAHLALAEALMANGLSTEACAQVQSLRDAGLAPPEITAPGSSLAACHGAG